MMRLEKITLSPFQISNKVSVELEEFEPDESNEEFLRDFAAYLGESLTEWFQGFEEGGGYFTYKGRQLFIYWSAFPLQISFDCESQATAQMVKQDLELFLLNNARVNL